MGCAVVTPSRTVGDVVLGWCLWCGVVWCGVVWCGVVWCGVCVVWRDVCVVLG